MFGARIRALGPAVVALLAFYGAVTLLAAPVLYVMPHRWTEGLVGLVAYNVPVIIAALIVNAALVRRGWSTWRTLGWPGLPTAIRGWAGGVAVGLVMAGGAIGIALVGGAAFDTTGEPLTAYLGAASSVLALLTIAALGEELVFRGYPLARLRRAVGPVAASLVLSLGFALVHLGNPHADAMGLLNVGLASLVLSAAFFTRGALPAAWGVHLGWNSGLGVAVDAPVSGLSFELPLVEFRPGDAAWLTGGSFGPEGGVAASVVMLAGVAWLVRVVRREEARTGANG